MSCDNSNIIDALFFIICIMEHGKEICFPRVRRPPSQPLIHKDLARTRRLRHLFVVFYHQIGGSKPIPWETSSTLLCDLHRAPLDLGLRSA